MKKLIFVFLLLAICINSKAHDIHVSVSDLMQKQTGELELTIKIFYDDLLAAVGLVPGEELPDDYTSSDDLIEKYLAKHFQVKINGKNYTFEYIETVASLPALWVTLNLDHEKLPDITDIQVSNTIFLDLFDDQTNMVNINIHDKKKTVALNHKENNFSMKIE